MNNKNKILTPSVSEVAMYQGATELALMLSFAHSHAKFFVNWLIAPKQRILAGHATNP